MQKVFSIYLSSNELTFVQLGCNRNSESNQISSGCDVKKTFVLCFLNSLFNSSEWKLCTQESWDEFDIGKIHFKWLVWNILFLVREHRHRKWKSGDLEFRLPWAIQASICAVSQKKKEVANMFCVVFLQAWPHRARHYRGLLHQWISNF